MRHPFCSWPLSGLCRRASLCCVFQGRLFCLIAFFFSLLRPGICGGTMRYNILPWIWEWRWDSVSCYLPLRASHRECQCVQINAGALSLFVDSHISAASQHRRFLCIVGRRVVRPRFFILWNTCGCSTASGCSDGSVTSLKRPCTS